jgi:hypothetical protein
VGILGMTLAYKNRGTKKPKAMPATPEEIPTFTQQS